jgi:hypothetical protein
MTSLDFQDREPPLELSRASDAQLFAGNRAFYERLQGQTRKTPLEKFGWVALPIAAVAIIGVVAVTSTPHQSANDVGGAPSQAIASAPATTSAPPAALASNSAPVSASDATAAEGSAGVTTVAKPAAAPPAPARVAKRAPASDSVTIRPASAAPAQSAPIQRAPARLRLLLLRSRLRPP